MYVKHSKDHPWDLKTFRIGKIYLVKYEDDLPLLLADTDTRNGVGAVYPWQVVDVIHDTKLNRVLYPDYEVIGDYLCPKL
jgi:hypothetical protein